MLSSTGRLKGPQRMKQLFALVGRTAVADHDGHCGFPRRGQRERHGRGQLIGRRFDEVVVETQDLPRRVQRVRQGACEYDVDRMKLVFEGGNDPKVASAASDAPEQVLVLLRACRQQLSVGGYHLG